MTVYIDGIAYETESGRNMLEVALGNGLNLPYFCWHPAMGSVGSCRLCAVKVFKDDNDSQGQIQMACMTPAAEGIRVSINDPDAAEFRRSVIEWLMINHPHDCPVCDEGGECHLQDMTAMCGQVYRRYRFPKRTHNNQDLGPFITHEMNRCIQCYRCVRFYRDLAGGRDLNVFASRNCVYFGRHENGVLESEFSGNLVEVCPTGVFTDKTFQKHYTRKWDLETAPSVCPHCGLGCNTIPGARYSSLRRVTAKYNGLINGYFLCDRGRFGYEYANNPRRLLNASIEGSAAGLEEAVSKAADLIKSAKGIVGIGSPRASLESNYALKKLVGESNFSNGLSSYESESAALALKIMGSGVHIPTLAELELADALVILGADLTNEAPMADFAARQAMRKAPLDEVRRQGIPDWNANAVANLLQNARGKLFMAVPWKTKLDGLASETFRGSYKEIAEYVHSIAAGQNGNAVFQAVREARKPVIITSILAGTQVLKAVAHFISEVRNFGADCGLFITAPEANTIGCALLGGISADDAVLSIESGQVDTLIAVENDITKRLSKRLLTLMQNNAVNIIAIDSITSGLTQTAFVSIPAAAVPESTGAFVNNECRAQRFYKVYSPRHNPEPSWRILQNIFRASGWQSANDLLREAAAALPAFAPLKDLADQSDRSFAPARKIPRMTHRYSGRTAKDANVSVVEPRPEHDADTPFSFTMEGSQNPPPGPLANRYWLPGWNSENAVSKLGIETGRPPRNIESGVRLSLPSSEDGRCNKISEPALAHGELWILPKRVIFGSEELSQLAPAISQLSPKPALYLNPAAAEKLGLGAGNFVTFSCDGNEYSLPISFDDSLPHSVAVVPFGLESTLGITHPFISEIKRAE